MSNSIGQNLLHQSSLYSTVLEHQSKLNSSSIPAYSLFQAVHINQGARKSPTSTKFYGTNLNVRKPKIVSGTCHRVTMAPRAVLATDPASELAGKFNLDGNVELQVTVTAPSQGSNTEVNFEISNSSNSLLLHWGGIIDIKEKWVLPTCQPDGTKVYKNRALRTPFVKSGSNSHLKVEIDDPSIQAIEFLILDEAKNKWFKSNGQNFHVKLPMRNNLIPNVSVPEDLVQLHAYLRWESKGKQKYSPEQEKEEYEAARRELLEEVTRGTSIEDLRTKLTNKNAGHEAKEPPLPEVKNKIPEDLIQIQAFIRWEKAGKPNYSPEEQLREFEEARKELQSELDKGVSLDEIRKKITKGEIQTKVSPQFKTKKYSTVERIQRKKRDPLQLLNKYVSKPMEKTKISVEPKASTAVELFAKVKEQQDGGSVLSKKVYKLADRELMVLVTKAASKTKIHLAADFKEPITLHWGLSRNAGEWLTPPLSAMPPGSVSVNGAVETQFTISSLDLPYQVQSLEIEIEEGSFTGMPFVLMSGGNWIKNNGSDFYANFSYESKKVKKDAGDGEGTAKALLDKIADMESEAQKSFMHRFNIAADLVEQAKNAGELGFAGILVWMRFMATRQLIWNKNYNVKPREISKAQDRLTDLLQNIYTSQPEYRELLRMIMSTVGRGGEGDVGQRIRDEILVIQRNNNCKGGMMEEWHQKLHNNTSPDDVVICQALMDYIKSDFDVSVYWKTLNENGITKERLLSYDRAIHSEPNFRRDQKDGLLRDLGHYMRTLKAVHSGADLESAIANCMGYRSEGQGFMVGVNINPIPGLPSGFPELLQFVLEHVEDRNVEPLLEGLLEARQGLRPLLLKSNDRLRDILFLDIALESTVRTAIERGYEDLNNAGPEKIMYFITLVLENLALSVNNNEDLIYCLKGWNDALNMSKSGNNHWALFAKSVLDRTRLALASKADWYQRILQPSAKYLGSLLGVGQWAVNIFTEEIIRAGSAAALSVLVNRLDPVLRKTANLGSWQVISPVEVVGYCVVVDELLTVQDKSYDRPTVLVAKHVKGEEEIPDGAVAVLTPDMPDVLSHVSVRARNSKVCFATCFDPNILADLQASEGKILCLKPTASELVYREVMESELADASSTNSSPDGPLPVLTLVKKQFAGRYAITSEEFTNEMVGAKSRNISYLKGKVPLWIGIPTSVALPFGVFEKVLAEDLNQGTMPLTLPNLELPKLDAIDLEEIPVSKHASVLNDEGNPSVKRLRLEEQNSDEAIVVTKGHDVDIESILTPQRQMEIGKPSQPLHASLFLRSDGHPLRKNDTIFNDVETFFHVAECLFTDRDQYGFLQVPPHEAKANQVHYLVAVLGSLLCEQRLERNLNNELKDLKVENSGLKLKLDEGQVDCEKPRRGLHTVREEKQQDKENIANLESEIALLKSQVDESKKSIHQMKVNTNRYCEELALRIEGQYAKVANHQFAMGFRYGWTQCAKEESERKYPKGPDEYDRRNQVDSCRPCPTHEPIDLRAIDFEIISDSDEDSPVYMTEAQSPEVTLFNADSFIVIPTTDANKENDALNQKSF